MTLYRRKRRSTKKPKKTILTKLRKLILIGIYAGLLGGICVFGFLYYLSQNLPALDDLIKPSYDLPSQIYDRDNNLITEFYTKRRVLIPFNKVPDVMVKALLAIEDGRFYQHFGISPRRIVKAAIVDITAGGYVQGASTLTQQTAKMFLLSSEKNITRKLKEALLALKIENKLTKNEILELYLNKAYFGHGAYGIEAAAQGYFSKHTEELNLAEAALLAGLPKAPSALAPTKSIEKAEKRRNQVLKMMGDIGYITDQERIRTTLSPVELKLNKNLEFNETSYYMEHVRRYIYDKYGQDQLYRGGLKVYTSMDLKMQVAAQNALHEGLIQHDHRQGFRGSQKNILKEIDEELGLFIYSDEDGWDWDAYNEMDDSVKFDAKGLFDKKTEDITRNNHFIVGGDVLGVVTKVNTKNAEVNLGQYLGTLLLSSMRWARPVNYEEALNGKTRLNDLKKILRIGDVILLNILDYDHQNKEFALVLTQKPIANGGIFVMDPRSGEVFAMAGGYDFRDSEFNRAIQSKRQTGSAFKPITYSLALDSSFTTVSMLSDSPFVADSGEGDNSYTPQNFSKSFQGKISLREALVHSKNVPSVNLTREIGTKAVIEHTRKLGITADMPEGELGIVLGQASISLMEMVKTYSIFANGGNLLNPEYITRIEDKEGNVLEEKSEEVEMQKVLSKKTAFLLTTILQDVVKRGSGWRTQVINRPSAGKTGTTDDYIDAWYIGYIPQLIAGVYVGFDKNQQTLGELETGSRAAAPIWANFMKEVVGPLPILPFNQPEGINMVRINPESGLLACDSEVESKFEYFKAGTEPTLCHRSDLPEFKSTDKSPANAEETEVYDDSETIEEL